MERRGGFSLVELLVVLVILAILAALLFPVFAQSKSRGKVAGCLSNLHQIDLAQRQYAADHEGYACPSQPGGKRHNVFWNAGRWRDGIHPYLKNDAVLICPADESPGKPYVRDGDRWSDKAISSYAAMYGDPWEIEPNEPARLNVDGIERPAEQMELMDLQLPLPDPRSGRIIARSYHGETMSFLYWDGHTVHKADPWLPLQRGH